MPELPQVETIRRNLSHQVINQRIADFKVVDERVLRGAQELFKSKTRGSYFKRLERWGAYLIFKLASGYYFFIYLSTTGELIYQVANEDISHIPVKHIRLVIEFENGAKLLFINSKSYGYFQILDDKQRKRLLVKLGFDPTTKGFSYLNFRQLLKNKRTSVSNFLINEKYLAGIGQIYAEEICQEARVSPEQSVRTLSDAQKKRLFKAITKVLRKAY